MARSISNTFKTAIFKQETSEIFHVLLEINHSSLGTPLRFANNTENVTSNSNVYTAFPFKIDFPPGDRDDQVPTIRLSICNVDRTIVEAIRNMTSAPTVDVSIVLESDPDTVEVGPLQFTLKNVVYDALIVEGELGFEDILNEGFPKDSFTPNEFPALF